MIDWISRRPVIAGLVWACGSFLAGVGLAAVFVSGAIILCPH